MRKIESTSDFTIDEMEIDVNHLHLMVTSKPNLSPTQIVRRLQQESTICMGKLFPKKLEKHFWKEKTFWTDGYERSLLRPLGFIFKTKGSDSSSKLKT